MTNETVTSTTGKTFSTPKNAGEEIFSEDTIQKKDSFSSDEELPENTSVLTKDQIRQRNYTPIKESPRSDDSVLTFSSDEEVKYRTTPRDEQNNSARSDASNARKLAMLRNDEGNVVPLGSVQKEDEVNKENFLKQLTTEQKTTLLKASFEAAQYDENKEEIDYPEHVAVGALLL